MVSHHHRCIFVHIPKNAGQSIETIFLNLLGLDWETRAPILLRENDNPKLGPPRLAHLTASEYLQYKYVSPEQFETYYKFAFVRNPWDRAVSFYKYMGKGSGKNFKQFLKEDLSKSLWKTKYWFVRPQVDYLFSEGRNIVNYVGKFENLQNDFNQICQHIELPKTNIPHANNSDNRKPRIKGFIKTFAKKIIKLPKKIETHKNFCEYYDPEASAIVAELYASDIKRFDYEAPATRTSD